MPKSSTYSVPSTFEPRLPCGVNVTVILPDCPGARRRGGKRSHRGLKLAFGIDEEVRRGNDVLPRFESFQDYEIVPSLLTRLDLARFEVTAPVIDKRYLTRPRLKHSGGGNDQLPAHRRFEADVDEHSEGQLHGRIWDFDPYLGRPRRLVHLRIDKPYASAK